ncbi:hypothetical protein KHQ81_13995 [Mycoplasmatota bacterium]|nr:hypothetical protein KHQ81_13995 [Mycoplasmatota bacterium]
MFKKIVNPDLYHGEKKKKNFFEGWYYKITDKENKYSFAFIPGIIKGKILGEGHSFIQVLDGKNHKFYYLKFTKGNFKSQHKPFSIEINNNLFSLKEIRLSHYDERLQVVGSLKIVDVIKWPDSLINPGSMGFYNYLWFMECYSQVCCLDGKLVGKLMINHEEIDFSGGKIYIEKNWGSNFPENYIWVQANNFFDENAALSMSMGRVPLGRYHFNGFLTAFRFNNKVYKFTSINRSKMDLEFDQNNVNITFKKDNYQLSIETRCKASDFMTIKGPSDGKMNRDVRESIISEVRVELIDLYKEMILFQGISQNSGVEIMGNIRTLLSK